MNWDKYWTLFHKAWGHASSSPEYDKEVWSEMQRMLWQQQEEEKGGLAIRG